MNLEVISRIYEALRLNKLDRVPVICTYMNFPATYFNVPLSDYLSNKKIFNQCFSKVINDYKKKRLI